MEVQIQKPMIKWQRKFFVYIIGFAFGFWILSARFHIMFTRSQISLFAFLAGSPGTIAFTPLETFYPIGLNDTSYITNTSLGSYGGIYLAPRDSTTSNVTYGTYNYCSMPHPRTPEYKLPAPVANGSVKAEIVYLEYLQRHQRRTMYNVLPSGEVSSSCGSVR